MKTVIDTSVPTPRVFERRARVILSAFFILTFLVSICYWFYTIYEIYTTDIKSIENVGEVWHYTGHQFLAFEASILSFLLFVAALKI